MKIPLLLFYLTAVIIATKATDRLQVAEGWFWVTKKDISFRASVFTISFSPTVSLFSFFYLIVTYIIEGCSAITKYVHLPRCSRHHYKYKENLVTLLLNHIDSEYEKMSYCFCTAYKI